MFSFCMKSLNALFKKENILLLSALFCLSLLKIPYMNLVIAMMAMALLWRSFSNGAMGFSKALQ